jgi:Outer membrane lipoprotein carrier protein LolA-like
MKKFWLLAALAMLSLAAHAADLVADVRARLAQPTVLRGEFEQSKQVAGFKKPLLSDGDFLVAKDRGVIWRTRKPFPGVLKLTPSEIVATQGGDVAFRLSAKTEPTVRVINGLMFALLNGDLSALSEQFKMEGSVEAKTWTLNLVPKQPGFAKILTHVELSGDQHVRKVVLDEANGDHTTIVFRKQNSEPDKLSAEEVARFE